MLRDYLKMRNARHSHAAIAPRSTRSDSDPKLQRNYNPRGGEFLRAGAPSPLLERRKTGDARGSLQIGLLDYRLVPPGIETVCRRLPVGDPRRQRLAVGKVAEGHRHFGRAGVIRIGVVLGAVQPGPLVGDVEALAAAVRQVHVLQVEGEKLFGVV